MKKMVMSMEEWRRLEGEVRGIKEKVTKCRNEMRLIRRYLEEIMRRGKEKVADTGERGEEEGKGEKHVEENEKEERNEDVRIKEQRSGAGKK